MKNETNQKEAKKKAPKNPLESPNFKGYSMEELRYQRAMIALRKEFSKAKVMSTADSLRHPLQSSGDNAMSKFGKAASIASKIFSHWNVLDYALVGLSIFGSGKKIYRLLGKKK